MSAFFAIAAVVGFVSSALGLIHEFLGISEVVRRVRKKWCVTARAPRCDFCMISNDHPDAQRLRCERNPNGIGHRYSVTLHA